MNQQYRQAIDAWFSDKEDALVRDISRLVSIRSVTGAAEPGKPFGPGPAAALEEALQLCADHGFQAENVEGYVGTADLCGEKPTLLHILAHLDVVDEGSGWTVTAPYAPRVENGMLYGRGSADDKGPAVAALYAMKAARELSGGKLKYNAKLILGTDEESGSSDVAHYYESHPYAPWAFSPDGDFPVVNIEKGSYKPTITAGWEESAALPRVRELHGGVRINVVPGEATAMVLGMDPFAMASIAQPMAEEMGVTYAMAEVGAGTRITCTGKSAHASTPDEGNNAITALLALLASLPLADCDSTRAIGHLADLFPHGDNYGATLGVAQKDDLSGGLSLTLSLLELSETGLSARFDARTPICANDENCRAVAEAAFARCGLTCTGSMEPPHHTPAEGPFIAALLDCYEGYTGQPGQCLAIGGGTYVHHIPGGVAFGAGMPGFQCNMHGADEHASVADLMTAARIFTQVLLEMCGEESAFTL